MFQSPMQALQFLTQISNDYIAKLDPAAQQATSFAAQTAISMVHNVVEPPEVPETPVKQRRKKKSIET